MSREYVPGVALHARERMEEIHGRDLTRAEWLHVVSVILDRRSLLSATQPNGSEIHGVAIGDLSIWVAYHPHQAVIVTVLPESTPSFAAAFMRKVGKVQPMLRRGAIHTWHRGSKVKSSRMPNRAVREHGRGPADAWEDGDE